MNYNVLAHPEEWADHIIILPEKDVCDKCLNKKIDACLGKENCPLKSKRK